MRGEPVHVECYAGGRGDERPVAVTLAGARREIVAIERAWREPGGERWFRVRLGSGEHLLLCHDEQRGGWEAR